MRDGPFGLPWFWNAVLGILAVTTVALVVLVFVDRNAQNAVAEAEAARYVPPEATASAGPVIPTVAFIGDSYAAGTGASTSSKRWVQLLATHEKWIVRNFAFGGTGYVTSATDGQRACGRASCPSYPSVIGTAKAASPSIVVVSGGRNDVGQKTAYLATGVRSFYAKLRAALPNAKIVAVSPIWDDDPAPAQLASIRADVKSAVTAVDGTYLDIGEPLGGQGGDVISDGVHPNDQGHAAIADAIEKALD